MKALNRGRDIFPTARRIILNGTPAMDSNINMSLEQQSSNDFYAISGITPEA